MIARAKETRRTQQEARQLVTAAIEQLLAAGEHPSPGRIGALTGLHRNPARRWRDRLLAEGVVSFELLPRGPARGQGADVGGLTGCTPEERAEIRERYLAVRAERMARHAPPSELHQPRLARVIAYAGPADEEWEGGEL